MSLHERPLACGEEGLCEGLESGGGLQPSLLVVYCTVEALLLGGVQAFISCGSYQCHKAPSLSLANTCSLALLSHSSSDLLQSHPCTTPSFSLCKVFYKTLSRFALLRLVVLHRRPLLCLSLLLWFKASSALSSSATQSQALLPGFLYLHRASPSCQGFQSRAPLNIRVTLLAQTGLEHLFSASSPPSALNGWSHSSKERGALFLP